MFTIIYPFSPVNCILDAVTEYINKWSNPSRNQGSTNKLAITRKSTEQLDLGRNRPAFFIQHAVSVATIN